MNARRRLVVHIGLPRTATTTIQKALAMLEPRLRERGVHIPRTFRVDTPGLARHAGLWFALRRPSGPGGPSLAALRRELHGSGAQRFVMSDERFGGASEPRLVRALAELTASLDVEVRVVAYVRPQCDYLESVYAERVRAGYERLPFHLFAAASSLGLPPARRVALDYGRLFAPWRAAFGDGLRVYPFERSRQPSGPAAHFLGRARRRRP